MAIACSCQSPEKNELKMSGRSTPGVLEISKALLAEKTVMRKVIAGVMMSLDGVMQAPGGPDEDPTGGFKFGGWVFPHFDEVSGQALDQLFAAPFDLLLGPKTYEIFAAYWPPFAT